MTAEAISPQVDGNGRLKRFALLAAFWTAIGLIFGLPRAGSPEPWQWLIALSLIHCWVWGLLTSFLLAFELWLPFVRRHLSRRIVVYLLTGPPWTALFVYVYGALFPSADYRPGISSFRDVVEGHLFVYFLFVGVTETYLYQQRYLSAAVQMEKLERRSSEARLSALRAQLDPHFLFNALNTISAQVSAEPEQAIRMLEHLGDLLRSSLESQALLEVSLAEDIAILEHYLAIQRIRFGERLRIGIRISPEARQALVPVLFLQPIVENAIRHGVSPHPRGGRIEVEADCLSTIFSVRVSDDGVGLPSGWNYESHKGLGMTITKERLEALHPQGSVRFAVTRRPAGGTLVVISFPCRYSESV